MFSVRTVLGDKATEVEQVPSFLKVAHQHTGQEEEQETKASCLVSSAFCCCCVLFFCLILGVCMVVWEWMSE